LFFYLRKISRSITNSWVKICIWITILTIPGASKAFGTAGSYLLDKTIINPALKVAGAIKKPLDAIKGGLGKGAGGVKKAGGFSKDIVGELSGYASDLAKYTKGKLPDIPNIPKDKIKEMYLKISLWFVVCMILNGVTVLLPTTFSVIMIIGALITSLVIYNTVDKFNIAKRYRIPFSLLKYLFLI